MPPALIAPLVVCMFAVCGLFVSEWRGWRLGRVVCKTLASSAFLAVALQAGAQGFGYGRVVLLALALSWVGDVLLLAPRGRVFLAGIGAFLLAHLVFAIAFAGLPMPMPVVLVTALVAAVAGYGILVWLWPYLQGFYRGAVTAYLIAILAMVTCAVAAAVGIGNVWLALAALSFAASDIAVARNRFVAPGFINRAWGQPLYYAAQIVFALSAGWVPVTH